MVEVNRKGGGQNWVPDSFKNENEDNMKAGERDKRGCGSVSEMKM